MEKSYELVVSNNRKYVSGICIKNQVEDMFEMKVWCGKNMQELAVLFVHYDLGGKRSAISNDGKYVATAKYEDYNDGKLFVYEVMSGRTIFVGATLRRIQQVMFDDDNNLVVATENNGIFIFNIWSGVCQNNIKGKEMYYNKYDENILMISEKNIKYKGKCFKSSTFAYLCTTGTPRGILLSEVSGNLYYYNDNRQLIWKSDCLEFGHFIDVYYDENRDIIWGILLNPQKKGDERMNLVLLKEDSGNIMSVYSIETASYVFVKDFEKVVLVNGKQNKYIIENNELTKNIF